MPSESKTRKEIREILDLCEHGYQALYNQGPIKRKGETTDSERLYSEIIAEEILNAGVVKRLTDEKFIKRISRKESYRVEGHNPCISDQTKEQTNREEEGFAKRLCCYCNQGHPLKEIGRFLDYQVPLKDVQSDKAGKIDLVSQQVDGGPVYLLELKYRNNPETLLRCALEIATYYQQLDRKKFLEDFKIPEKTPIKKGILLVCNCNPYQEALDMGNRPRLKELIEALEVSIFVVTDGPPYSVDTLMMARTDT